MDFLDAFRYIATVQQFRLHSFAVQLDYPPAFLLWDKAGRVARDLALIWAGYKVLKAEPGTISGICDKAQIDVTFDKSFVKLIRPSTLTAEAHRVTDSVHCWIKWLELAELNKVGLRAVYIKEFDSREACAEYFRSMGLVKSPERKVFNCDPQSPLITGSVNFQLEDDAALNMIRVYAQDIRAEIENFEDFPEISLRKEKHRLVIDVDRQTKKPTFAPTLRVDEIVKGFAHLVNRDLTSVVGAHRGL